MARTPRVEQQTTQPKQRILDAAALMFAERGYAATGMQDLAAELGLTRAALYYHYPGKADILREIIDTETANFFRSLDGIAALTSRSARLEATIDALVGASLSQRSGIVFLLADPAIRTLSDPVTDHPPLPEHVAGVIYGATPKPEQIFAVNAAFMTFAALPSFAHLTDKELTPILASTLHRLLNVR